MLARLKRWWSAPIPVGMDGKWTLAHVIRYGRDPAKTIRDEQRYRAKLAKRARQRS